MTLTLDIPKDRRRQSVVKLCVLLGLTVLLYMLILHQFSITAEALVAAAKPKI